MKQPVIENPVINSPYQGPARHFRFTDDGITNEILDGRRPSAYFVPIAKPKKRGRQEQLSFDTEWTQDRVEENKFVNQIREKVTLWRRGGYKEISNTTGRLLEYWQQPERDHKLFYCQIEAAETCIYLTEVARKHEPWIENRIVEANQDANPLLFRIAFKMATGTGKTVVMAMLISYHVVNKLANPQDSRFSDAFLIVTPGITIKDRLRVLLPNDPNNFYRHHDIIPPEDIQKLGQAKIIITNFHTFLPREKGDAGKLTKQLLKTGETSAFTESPDEVVRRACRELGSKKNIIVINDEAHHCYRRRVGGEDIKLVGDDRKEAEKREKEARIWISGLEYVKEKIGIKTVYDLSATPFFLRGSGYSEGTLFPWVVSDFSLIDSIESGIVKVPRVPVADNSMTGEQPTYRNLWIRIRDQLPKKGRGTEDLPGDRKLPAELEGALISLYSNYEKYYKKWQRVTVNGGRLTPPVFIVVCNNTNVSKLVFDYIAGWEKTLKDGSIIPVPGSLALFSNVESGRWSARPNTILVDSQQLESGEGMSDEFKKVAAREIEKFKDEIRERFPGRPVEEITDEDLLREVMNTIGKPGKLGEQVKCVVSVSMLTEGWDANTVTHILGVRAFGTQLLCEQVVGRGLRRMSFALTTHSIKVNGSTIPVESFVPEYAEVYGVPFSFIPCSGSPKDPKPGPMPTRVRALEERAALEMNFPRLIGYRYEWPSEKLTAKFTKDSQMAISTADLPTRTENAPIVGEISLHDIYDLEDRRLQQVAFLLARETLEKYFRDSEGGLKQWLFPQILNISRQWLEQCVTCKDNTFPQMLLIQKFAVRAADKIYHSIIASDDGVKSIQPILRPYDAVGSTRYVDFDTTRPVYPTREDKCHVSHVVADTESWEQKMAQSLEDMDEVISYVKNQGLGFYIPYTLDGDEKNYQPDFIVRLDDGHGREDPLNLIVEVSGEPRRDKAAKAATARNLWVPAINNQGGYGRWAFLEISDPWDAINTIRASLQHSAIRA